MLSTSSEEWSLVGRAGADVRRAAFARARAHWSGFELTFDQFASHLDRLGWSAQLPRQIEPVYLCAACSLGSAAACNTLEREYFPALRVAMARRYHRWDFVDDVLQQTRERLMVGAAPRIATYRGNGSLSAWLRRVASRIALDLRRAPSMAPMEFVDWQRHQSPAVAEAPGTAGAASSVQSSWALWVERALIEALGALEPPQRSMLRMFYVQGAKIEEIGRCYGIDRSTAYRRLRRAEGEIRRGVIDAVRAKTGLSTSDELRDLLWTTCDQLSVDSNAWDMPPMPHGERASD